DAGSLGQLHAFDTETTREGLFERLLLQTAGAGQFHPQFVGCRFQNWKVVAVGDDRFVQVEQRRDRLLQRRGLIEIVDEPSRRVRQVLALAVDRGNETLLVQL